MSGFKDFVDGVPLYEAELDGYLMKQTVMRFATTTAMTNALGAGVREVGMLAWTDNGGVAEGAGTPTGVLWMWDGTNWVPWASPEKAAALTITAGGTNITFSNSTVSQKWRWSGGLVQVSYTFTQGSTANMQAGTLAITLPIAAHATDGLRFPLGHAFFYDVSADGQYPRTVVTGGTATLAAFISEANVKTTPATPYVMATGDMIVLNLHYRPTDSVKL